MSSTWKAERFGQWGGDYQLRVSGSPHKHGSKKVQAHQKSRSLWVPNRSTTRSRLREWPQTSDRSTPVSTKVDYFRFVDTRLRRVESGGVSNSRLRLTGPRLAIKGILDLLGRYDAVYPTIGGDGDGGVFAEWTLGDTRIEVVVDDELSGHVSVAIDGKTTVYDEFNQPDVMNRDVLRRLRLLIIDSNGSVRVAAPGAADQQSDD